MKLVVFGLTISSSWGNGHATLWRGLARALGQLGVKLVFFEKDVPYYAAHRDEHVASWGELVLYDDFDRIRDVAASTLEEAEAAVVTSFCPDGVPASELVWRSPVTTKVFYDLDTPVTLGALAEGRPLTYIGDRGLSPFDLVLSYTGGAALAVLRGALGAKRVAPLYGWVDEEAYRPVTPVEHFRADLSHLGTYAADRRAAIEELFVAPALAEPRRRFVLGGAQYPQDFVWSDNIFFMRHVPPHAHPGFFSSARLSLNITRAEMARWGFCPSGRLFEASACGAPLISDFWPGLDRFFAPQEEILIASTCADIRNSLRLSDRELDDIGRAARERTLRQHTAKHRARELLGMLGDRSH